MLQISPMKQAFIILSLLLLWPSCMSSQVLRDYSYVVQAEPWLTSTNAAGLTRYASPNIATAELSLSKQEGGLTNYDGSPNVTLWDAGIASYYRITSRAVLYGSMSFSSFSGKDHPPSFRHCGRLAYQPRKQTARQLPAERRYWLLID